MTVSPGPEEFDIYEVLANERRRLVLVCLLNHDGPLGLRELADQVAAREADESPPPDEKRHSVYTALTRVHLPKLDRQGVVRYDSDANQVALDERAHNLHLEIVPDHELTWAEYYLALGALALAMIGLATLGLPIVGDVAPTLWAGGYFALYIASAVYQLQTQSRRLLGRVRG